MLMTLSMAWHVAICCKVLSNMPAPHSGAVSPFVVYAQFITKQRRSLRRRARGVAMGVAGSSSTRPPCRLGRQLGYASGRSYTAHISVEALCFTPNAIFIAIEMMRIGRQDPEVVIRDFGTV
jgi:hypothetical protein